MVCPSDARNEAICPCASRLIDRPSNPGNWMALPFRLTNKTR